MITPKIDSYWQAKDDSTIPDHLPTFLRVLKATNGTVEIEGCFNSLFIEDLERLDLLEQGQEFYGSLYVEELCAWYVEATDTEEVEVETGLQLLARLP